MTVVTNKNQTKSIHRFPKAPTLPAIPSPPRVGQGTRPSQITRLLASSLVLLLVAVGWQWRQPLLTFVYWLGDQAAVSATIQSYGAWGPLALAIGQLLQVLLAVIPGHVFLVAAGYVYGFGWGLLLNVVTIVAASQLGFMLARWLGRPFIERLVAPDTLAHWYRLGEKQGFRFFTLTFLLPLFPTDLMNFVAGLSGISGRKFLAANFLGRLPGAVLLTLIGSHGLAFSRGTWLLLGVSVATVYILGQAVMMRLEHKLRQRTGGEATAVNPSLD